MGAILLRNNALEGVLQVGLRVEHFSKPSHRVIFEKMVLLRGKRKKAIDLPKLAIALKDSGKYNEVGGSKALCSLFKDTFSIDAAVCYAQKIISFASP